jgi:hypothetical protein
MATLSLPQLSPRQQSAAIVLAGQAARNAVKRRLQRRGIKLALTPYAVLNRLQLRRGGIAKLPARAGDEAKVWVQGSSPHAAARLRVQAHQRRPRHTRDPSLSRASQYSEYDALHGIGTAAV